MSGKRVPNSTVSDATRKATLLTSSRDSREIQPKLTRLLTAGALFMAAFIQFRQATDEQLVESSLDGNRDAFQSLVSRHRRFMKKIPGSRRNFPRK